MFKLENLFSINETTYHKEILFCGINFKIRKNAIKENKKLLSNKDFDLDKDFFKLYLSNREIEKFKLQKIHLSEIKKSKTAKLDFTQTPTYHYLDGERSEYKAYCKNEQKSKSILPSVKTKFFNYTPQRYDKLIKDFQKNGYNEKNVIVLDSDYILLDGKHRASLLCHRYGEDYCTNALIITFKEEAC